MKFGKVDNVEGIDLTLPSDHPDTKRILSSSAPDQPLSIYVGCAKWNRQELKGFYPRGTKDELQYYASQFNSIEMNSTFYRIWSTDQVKKWRDKVDPSFRFFPKLFQGITHVKRLRDAHEMTNEYLHSIDHLSDRLGMIFMQMHSNFAPKQENVDRLLHYLEHWPRGYPLALELRHTDWYNDTSIADMLCTSLARYDVTNIITDTAGRRDLLHMRLTTTAAFVRYVGANHASDYDRVSDWVDRIQQWVEDGLRHVYFFVHQNNEIESVNISRSFIKKLNERLDIAIKCPDVLGGDMPDLFS